MVPIFSYILEDVKYKQFSEHSDKNNSIISTQFYFHQGKSTTQATELLIIKITEAFESKQHVLLTLCDLSKAFDGMVTMFFVLNWNIMGYLNSLELINSLLNEHNQAVFVNNVIDNCW